jgi:Lipid A core - O-antigen ligase and related enzymes
VFGHGLDAARLLGEDAVLRGEPFNTLPLHAHNLGLHIWLETGFVGAALFSAALAALGWRCMRSDMTSGAAAGAGFAGAAYLATVMVGSGVWQEWLHGCLAAGLAGAAMIRR